MVLYTYEVNTISMEFRVTGVVFNLPTVAVDGMRPPMWTGLR